MEKYLFEGTEIELKQDAYITGGLGEAYFEAHAVDTSGNDYMVTWDIKEEYKELMETEDIPNDMLCDWDNPSDIKKI